MHTLDRMVDNVICHDYAIKYCDVTAMMNDVISYTPIRTVSHLQVHCNTVDETGTLQSRMFIMTESSIVFSIGSFYIKIGFLS